MQVAHLRELAELEDTYWWHIAKRQLALELLDEFAPPPGLLIEGGIGSARNLLAFRERGYDVHGLDVMPEAISMAGARDLPATLHDLAQPWPFDDDSLRAVVLLDVLEHIDDPIAVLRNARKVLSPGGAVIVTVPAYPWLFSDWDAALGHFRRYTQRVLRAQSEEAGLKVLRLSHWNAFTLPAAVAVRGYQRFRPSHGPADFPRVSSLTNSLLLGCAAAERAVLHRLSVPCGLSIAGVLSR